MVRKITTIQISLKTKERLSVFGKFGMSYDEVINDALDQLEDAIARQYLNDNDEEDEEEEDE